MSCKISSPSDPTICLDDPVVLPPPEKPVIPAVPVAAAESSEAASTPGGSFPKSQVAPESLQVKPTAVAATGSPAALLKGEVSEPLHKHEFPLDIARRYGVSLTQLREWNPALRDEKDVDADRHMLVGAAVTIQLGAGKGISPTPAEWQQGDTVQSFAARNNSDKQTILNANRLVFGRKGENTPQAGAKLWVPAPRDGSAPVAAEKPADVPVEPKPKPQPPVVAAPVITPAAEKPPEQAAGQSPDGKKDEPKGASSQPQPNPQPPAGEKAANPDPAPATPATPATAATPPPQTKASFRTNGIFVPQTTTPPTTAAPKGVPVPQATALYVGGDLTQPLSAATSIRFSAGWLLNDPSKGVTVGQTRLGVEVDGNLFENGRGKVNAGFGGNLWIDRNRTDGGPEKPLGFSRALFLPTADLTTKVNAGLGINVQLKVGGWGVKDISNDTPLKLVPYGQGGLGYEHGPFKAFVGARPQIELPANSPNVKSLGIVANAELKASNWLSFTAGITAPVKGNPLPATPDFFGAGLRFNVGAKVALESLLAPPPAR
jgi:hypothetical protein